MITLQFATGCIEADSPTDIRQRIVPENRYRNFPDERLGKSEGIKGVALGMAGTWLLSGWGYRLGFVLATMVSIPLELASQEHVAQQHSNYKVFVTNENSGDLSIIDPEKAVVLKTVALGKRPRGIQASPDRRKIYVALSGSPYAPPGVDESTLPPADKSADGIGVVDIREGRVARVISSGSDPEQFDISKDGKLLFVSNEDSGQMSVVDIAVGKPVKEVDVGEEPEGVRVRPDGKVVYVTSENTGTVTALDCTSGRKITTMKVGRRPRSIAFLPNGSRAYITAENDGAVTLVDSVRHRPMRTIRLGQAGIIKPMGVAVSSDGRKAYVSTGRGHKVFVIDTRRNVVVRSFDVGERPWGVTLSPDGKTLFTANGPSNDVSIVDLATGTVSHKVKVGRGPWGIIALREP